jgi:imidazolonepropionase-like amidohydrolase
MRQRIELLLVMIGLVVSAAAQQPANSVVIRAGRLLDVKTGKMLANQTIVIEGERIVSVGSTAPAGAKVIDLPNATVLPGMIDVHTHLTLDPQDLGLRGLAISVPREALTGAKNARATLLAGFTTVRNVGAHGYSQAAEKCGGIREGSGFPQVHGVCKQHARKRRATNRGVQLYQP